MIHQIPVYAPWITAEDAEEVKRGALSGWISSSAPDVVEFESEFAREIGSRFAVSCSNGTTALHLALLAARIGRGDEVIVPDLTFVATASMVVACGATPVFADVSEDDWNLTAESVARCVTPHTRALIVVHLYGNPAHCDALREAAPGCLVIEDVAEACGASRCGVKAGASGALGCYSFFANKILTTGQGGMVVTNDAEMAERMRFMRGHAMSADRRYFHPELGFNYGMTGLQAALGRSQLRRLSEILLRKRAIAKLYAERLVGIPELTLHPAGPKFARSIFWMYSILAASSSMRNSIMRELQSKGIETRPFFHPMSSLPSFAACNPDTPVSHSLSARGINLPSGPLTTETQIDFIADAVRAAIGR